MKSTERIPKPKKVRAPLTKRKLAKLLGVSEFILRKWLKSIKELIGEPVGYKYSVKQVRLIAEQFGVLVDFENPEHPKHLREQMEYNKLQDYKAELIKEIKDDPSLKLRRFIG